MNLIDENLFLGDVKTAHDESKLRTNSISHILSIDLFPIPKISQFEKIDYEFVQANDRPEVDLLQHFDFCFSFIHEAISKKNGKVFVHCQFGISRSATIAAAYLMRRYSLSRDDALTKIKAIRPFISPNEGFLYQLELYQCMNFRVDTPSPIYRHYRLIKISENCKKSAPSKFELNDLLMDIPPETVISQDQQYKCRQCRCLLFNTDCLLYHNKGVGPCTTDPAGLKDKCNCLYLFPVRWMHDSILEQQGKIYCHKCRAKLGGFRWSGLKCGCDVWVTPGFHIQNCKVDLC